MAEVDVELRENNLYRNGTHYVFSGGEELLIRPKLSLIGDIRDQYHIVKKGDRIDLIAYKYYSKRVEDSSKFWWVIADANDIQNPLDIEQYVGKQILIPNISNLLLLSL